MGGVISQLAALKHPERVASLTAMSTSPVGMDTSNLPQTSEAYTEHAAEAENVDWSDRSQVIEFMVKDSRMIAGTAHPYDEARARRLIARDVHRARSFASTTNHFMLKGGDKWQGRLHAMQAPLLVIHGTADPIFPVEHGVALSQAVAGARLVKLEGAGHELHRADWDEIIITIVEHTDAK
jgi:pimeloyl-ACP methyl ester carboxylesterase